MKKYISSFSALLVALILTSFTSEAFKPDRLNYYFKFSGVHNSEESVVTKWDEITATAYSFLNCSGAHYGCKLIATSTQTISGVTRPAAIYLASGTNNPITGTHVSEVKNYTDAFF